MELFCILLFLPDWVLYFTPVNWLTLSMKLRTFIPPLHSKLERKSATFIVSITFRREPKRHYINFGEFVCRRVGLSAKWIVGELSINLMAGLPDRCLTISSAIWLQYMNITDDDGGDGWQRWWWMTRTAADDEDGGGELAGQLWQKCFHCPSDQKEPSCTHRVHHPKQKPLATDGLASQLSDNMQI